MIKGFKKTLTSLILTVAFTLGAQAKLIIYRPGYGFPNYKSGPLSKQGNWQSSDTIDKKGWQVINKGFQKNSKYLSKSPSQNVLCFKPASDFNDFSAENNYATFHIQTEKPIKKFLVSGEYLIQKNGSINVFVSDDNKNWEKIQHFNSRGRDNYKIGWGSSLYCEDYFKKLKLKNDLYIRHSVSAKENKNYSVEIWRFYASVITE